MPHPSNFMRNLKRELNSKVSHYHEISKKGPLHLADKIFDAISKRELPPATTNLIFDHPRTSRFYLLPRIHSYQPVTVLLKS